MNFYLHMKLFKFTYSDNFLINKYPSSKFSIQVSLKFDGILTCGGTLVKANNGTIFVVTGGYCGDG